MKLLTLNLHNLPLTWKKEHMDTFAAAVSAEHPDVIALQEVFAAEKGESDPIAPILDYLALCGMRYHGVWKPVKIGYGTYRERCFKTERKIQIYFRNELSCGFQLIHIVVRIGIVYKTWRSGYEFFSFLREKPFSFF